LAISRLRKGQSDCLATTASFREPEDREVQVGRIFGRLAEGAAVAQHLPALNVIALLEPVGVALEMGVLAGRFQHGRRPGSLDFSVMSSGIVSVNGLAASSAVIV
jgi:hypothetical protein